MGSSDTDSGISGVNDVRFDLSDLYRDLDDPAVDRDIQTLATMCREFEKKYRGQLSTLLGQALTEMQAIQRLNNKLSLFLHLQQACDAANQRVQQVLAKARESWARASANHLTFFEQETGRGLSEEAYQQLLTEDPVVRHHKPFLDQIRKCAVHLLSEEGERALILREPFSADEWVDLVSEAEVGLRFAPKAAKSRARPGSGGRLGMAEMLDMMLNHQDSEVRFDAMRVLNRGLKSNMAPVAARALNLVIGLKNVEDDERAYSHAMAARNLNNMVSDEVVDALHNAVISEGPRLARRYYKLLAAHLGKRKLRWSDRTANPVRNASASIPWDQAFEMVERSYQSFSPFLAEIVRRMFERRWIDAPSYRGKTSGAFNYSVDLPEPLGIRSYTFLNYQGSERDVLVIAHELGHAVHGVVAAQAQGVLMFRAPMVYAETASIFGEMLTFNFLLQNAENEQRRLSLYMDKASDFISSVLRQISFSLFEKRVHAKRRSGKLTVDDFCESWMEVTTELYGRDGDVFQYQHMEYLWSYVSHFLNPFYVYAYAFGALLTQSLFAVKDNFKDDFQRLYLDLLKAGGTRDAVDLLKPFGLDPADPAFWVNGMRESLGGWLHESEKITRDMGLVI